VIAQEVAIRCPERVKSLLLVSTYAAVDDWSRRVLEMRRSMIERLGLADHFRLSVLFVFSPKAFRTMRDWIAGLEQALAERPPDQAAYLRQLDFCLAHDASQQLAAVSVPTLVLTGAEDILTSRFQGRELAGRIGGAEYREVPEASHGLVWEEPTLFAETVADFVRRHSQ
jgi:3-oxoadipate enol-lactonase